MFAQARLHKNVFTWCLMKFYFCALVCLFYLLSCGSFGKKSQDTKSCESLDKEKCEQYKTKICRLINNDCKEIKACDDLSPLGQSGCNDFGNEKCQWANNKCAKESILLADFMKIDRTFKFDPGNYGVTGIKITDMMSILSGGGQSGTLSGVKFGFLAHKKEVLFTVKKAPTDPFINPGYKFTYQAIDLDDDTMKINLKGMAPMTGNVGPGVLVNGVIKTTSIDLVEPFERALFLYKKSSDELYFLLVEKASDEPKFAGITKPSDFIFRPLRDRIKGITEGHTAFVLKP
jgi:hypothetical protein